MESVETVHGSQYARRFHSEVCEDRHHGATLRRLGRNLIVATIALLLTYGPASGACVDYTQYLNWVGRADIANDPVVYALDIVGSYAYAACGTRGLQILNIMDPQRPTVVGGISTLGDARDVLVVDNLAYVAAGSSGLRIVDVSVPENPTDRSTVTTSGIAQGLAISGAHVFVAVGSSGVRVVDVTDPDYPVQGQLVATSGQAYGVAVSGARLYVANGSAGLRIYDIQTPSQPEYLGHRDTTGTAHAVLISGLLAYVAGGASGLQIIDVTSPGDPQIVGTQDTPGEAYDVSLRQPYAYLADYTAGVCAINISNPSDPELLGGASVTNAARGIATTETHAFAGDYKSVQSFSIAGAESVPVIASLAPPYYTRDVALSGDHAYVACTYSFHVVDVSEPENPVVASSLSSIHFNSAVTIVGDVAYLANAGLSIVDISHPASPQPRGSVVLSVPYANDVVVSGSYAFLSSLYSLAVINVSDWNSPVIETTFTDQAMPALSHLALDGTHLLVCGYGLAVVDISTPASPQVLGSMYVPGYWTNAVAVAGNHAFLAADEDGFLVVDISNPAALEIVGSAPTEGPAVDVVVIDDTAYVTDELGGVQALDVSVPSQPRLLGRVESDDAAYGLAATTHNVFIANGTTGGLLILPAHCPEMPVVLLSSFQLEVAAGMVTARWEAVGEGMDFLLEARLGDVSWQVPFAQEGAGRYIAVDASPLLAAGGTVRYTLRGREAGEDWQLLRSESIMLNAFVAGPRLLRAYPNPLNPATAITFVLPQASAVSLAIVDLSGRRVRSLASGSRYEAGQHAVTWDGRDDTGRSLPSGIYLCRLAAGGRTETNKLTLLK